MTSCICNRFRLISVVRGCHHWYKFWKKWRDNVHFCSSLMVYTSNCAYLCNLSCAQNFVLAILVKHASSLDDAVRRSCFTDDCLWHVFDDLVSVGANANWMDTTMFEDGTRSGYPAGIGWTLWRHYCQYVHHCRLMRLPFIAFRAVSAVSRQWTGRQALCWLFVTADGVCLQFTLTRLPGLNCRQTHTLIISRLTRASTDLPAQF